MRRVLSQSHNLVRRLRRVAACGPRRRDAAWIWLVGIWLVVRPLLSIRSACSCPVIVNINGQLAQLVLGDRSEINVLEEILVDDEYRDVRGRAATEILDLGSNIGASVLYFRSLFPMATIVAVEPNPTTFQRLAANVGRDPHVRCVQAAITAKPGAVAFAAGSLSWSSHIDHSGCAATTVSGITLADLCQQQRLRRIDILKIDIEGAEWEVLETADLTHVCYVIGEVHPDPARDVADWLTRITHANGFRPPRYCGKLFVLHR
jgi:FkbM family methyltransferase